TGAELSGPFAVSPTRDGGFLVADSGNDRIRGVRPDGTITTVAGNGTKGFAGDGGPATRAELDGIHGVTALATGFLVADTNNNRIRYVDGAGTITTVAGTGAAALGGHGGPAALARPP